MAGADEVHRAKAHSDSADVGDDGDADYDDAAHKISSLLPLLLIKSCKRCRRELFS